MERHKLNYEGVKLNLFKNPAVAGGKYHLPGNDYWTAQCECLKLTVQQFDGHGYQIWHNRYEIKKPGNFTFALDRPLLAFHTQLSDGFRSYYDHRELTAKRGQFGIVSLARPEINLQFSDYGDFETFTTHLDETFLLPYASCSQRLAEFLANARTVGAKPLTRSACYLPLSMEHDIRAMLTYNYHSELAARFMEGKVHELLTHLVHHLNGLGMQPRLDPLEAGKAETVKMMIAGDLSRYDSVEVLARKVHTGEAKLQATFKQLYGTTVGKFSRELRLNKAHEMLSDEDNRETLLSIALSVGYNDVANFCNAFKNTFGYPPGHIHKIRKRAK